MKTVEESNLFDEVETLSIQLGLPIPEDDDQFVKFSSMSKNRLLKYSSSKSNYRVIERILSQTNNPSKGGYHAAKHGDIEIMSIMISRGAHNHNRILEGAVKNGARRLVNLVLSKYDDVDRDYMTVVAHAYRKDHLVDRVVEIPFVEKSLIIRHNISNPYYIKYLMIRRGLSIEEAVARYCLKRDIELPQLSDPTKIIPYAVKKGKWYSLFDPDYRGVFLAAFLRYHQYDNYEEINDGESLTPQLYHAARLGSNMKNVKIVSQSYKLDWDEVMRDAVSNGSVRNLNEYSRSHPTKYIKDLKLDSIEGVQWLIDNNYQLDTQTDITGMDQSMIDYLKKMNLL